MSLVFMKNSRITNFDPDMLQANTLWAATDADFGNDLEESKSVSGYVVFLNGLIAWRSKRQSIVATSTCYAEYIAASEVARELAWIRSILTELGLNLPGPTTLLEDNVATELLAKKFGASEKSKHIRIRFHYVRECVVDGAMTFEHIASKANPADALTKAPKEDALQVMFKATNMRPVSDVASGGCLPRSAGSDGDSSREARPNVDEVEVRTNMSTESVDRDRDTASHP